MTSKIIYVIYRGSRSGRSVYKTYCAKSIPASDRENFLRKEKESKEKRKEKKERTKERKEKIKEKKEIRKEG